MNKLIFYLCSLILTVNGVLRSCKQNETSVLYTSCNVEGTKWGVKIPANPSICQVNTSNSFSVSCDIKCPAGTYFNSNINSCDECPPGSYSVGSQSIRFDQWDVLPEGFTVTSESLFFEDNDVNYNQKSVDCSESKWKPSGNYIESNKDDCASLLSYSATLINKGHISFEYQHYDEDVLFHFYVQNDRCEPLASNKTFVFLNTTAVYKWKTWQAPLEKGSYIFYWSVNGILLDATTQLNPVKISNIQITGLDSTSEGCIPCKAGYYSPRKSSKTCEKCGENKYSTKGSSKCISCETGHQYSIAGSSKCTEMKICTEKDYIAVHSNCDDNMKMSITYKWVEPRICKLTPSTKLPKSLSNQPCSPCNPGNEPANNTCVPCNPDYYSDGLHSCRKCPPNTQANSGFWYLNWNKLPENMRTSRSNTEFTSDKTWIPSGNRIVTSPGNTGDDFLILMLLLRDQKHGDSTGVEFQVGVITFEFEVECQSSCQFYFMAARDRDDHYQKSWEKSQTKQKFKFNFKVTKKTTTFWWAFKKDNPVDTASLHSINITNIQNGVANKCEKCHFQTDDKNKKCVPCSPGNHLTSNNKCVPCDKQGYNDVFTFQPSTCKLCDIGTYPNMKRDNCMNDCSFAMGNDRYNFSSLPPHLTVKSANLFTNANRKYNYVYNISLCGNQGIGTATCFNDENNSEYDVIKGMVCRTTHHQLKRMNDKTTVELKYQSVLLATKIQNVIQPKDHFNNDVMNMTEQFGEDIHADDIVFHLRQPVSSYETDDCPNGNSVFIYLKCDPTIQDYKATLPQKCPTGTCDGCNFLFLIATRHACPLCSENDFYKVEENCRFRTKNVRYMWKKYPHRCHGGLPLPESGEMKCFDWILMGVSLAVSCIIVLCLVVVHQFKKSKKMEYKYSKLVLDSGNLPRSETCALEDSDELSGMEDSDEDKVVFTRKKKKKEKKKLSFDDSVRLLSANA